jgi:putative transposase
MRCKTYELKIDRSRLLECTVRTLNLLFLEAKWLYNYLVETGDVRDVGYKITSVAAKTRDGKYENRPIVTLSSQMKQAIISRTKDNMQSLLRLQSSSHKIGVLSYKSRVNSIPLKQFGNTYRLGNNHVTIQGVKQLLRVRGLDKIPAGSEFTNAVLVKRGIDFFIHVTTDQKLERWEFPMQAVGVDAGIKHQLTLSNGIRIDEEVKVTEKAKRLHHELSRKKPHGKNWRKAQLSLHTEYAKIRNRRLDIRHKIVSKITSSFDTVVVQDDNITGWRIWWGGSVTTSAIGGIIRDLRTKAHTPILVDRFLATTQPCWLCGAKREMTLGDRDYACFRCDQSVDRDLNSARIIWKEIPAERRELTPVDIKAAAELVEYFNSIPRVHASLVDEAGSQLSEMEATIPIEGSSRVPLCP